ncbi:MAG: hypothetical protein V4485_05830 [Pseudomonadota bacterium]
MKIIRAPHSAIAYLACKNYHEYEGDHLLICGSEEDARLRVKQISFFDPNIDALYFPSWDSLPFDRISPSASIMAARASVLAKLSPKRRHKKSLEKNIL